MPEPSGAAQSAHVQIANTQGANIKRRAAFVAQLVALVVVLKPVSNLLLAYGERRFSSVPMVNPLLYVASLFDPFVAAGVLMQIWWLLTRMKLFSVADLTFVIPVTAIGYVLTSLLGKFFLHEIISPIRWAGIALVCLGSMLVAGTRRNTTETGSR